MRRRIAGVGVVVLLLGGCGGNKAGTKASLTPGGGKTAKTAALVPQDNEPTTVRVLSCGTERWPVKTGTDADVGSVDTVNVQPTTIEALTGLPEPSAKPQDHRVAPVETTVYELSATLKEFITEKDSDHHLVLEDLAGHHMIAEIASPDCAAGNDPLRAALVVVRTAFDGHFPHKSGRPNVPVTVRGVGFFDVKHAKPQHGVAPNNIELHPVLAISFG
jgi:hypothetical protein